MIKGVVLNSKDLQGLSVGSNRPGKICLLILNHRKVVVGCSESILRNRILQRVFLFRCNAYRLRVRSDGFSKIYSLVPELREILIGIPKIIESTCEIVWGFFDSRRS